MQHTGIEIGIYMIIILIPADRVNGAVLYGDAMGVGKCSGRGIHGIEQGDRTWSCYVIRVKVMG